nr:hypothetical protein [Vibrio hyugaensis]
MWENIAKACGGLAMVISSPMESLKCPPYSQVEMSLYELNRVGELGFTLRSFEGFWCNENWVYRP